MFTFEDDDHEAEIDAVRERLAAEELTREGVASFRELRVLRLREEFGLDPGEIPDDDTAFELEYAANEADDVVEREYMEWMEDLFEAYIESEMEKEHEHLMATDPAYRADYEAQEARREAASTARALANPEPETDVPF